MSNDLRHPGANPRCDECVGQGIRIVRDGGLAVAVTCHCVKTCPACRGTGLVATGEGFRAPRRRCDCMRIERRMRAFDGAQIPGRYYAASLANFDTNRGSLPAFIAVNSYLKSFKPGEDNRGIVLHGEVGRGKTHLMIAVLRELILRYGVTARFIEFSHLLADLKLSFGRRSGETDLMVPLSKVQVLAIDELGKGRNTEFEGTVLDELISRRYNAAATILGTTNHTPGLATRRAAPNLSTPHETAPTLVDRVGERVYSRIREMCDFAPVTGDDYREFSRRQQPPKRRP